MATHKSWWIQNIQISYNDVENKTEHEQIKEAPFITSYSCMLSIKCAVWKKSAQFFEILY